MDRDKLVQGLLKAVEDLDPERTSKVVIAPLIMAFFGVWRIQRHLDRLLPIKVSFGRVWSVITILNWVVYYVARQATGGYLNATDAHEAAKKGLKK